MNKNYFLKDLCVDVLVKSGRFVSFLLKNVHMKLYNLYSRYAVPAVFMDVFQVKQWNRVKKKTKKKKTCYIRVFEVKGIGTISGQVTLLKCFTPLLKRTTL